MKDRQITVYIQSRGRKMKDQQGQPLKRPFAKEKRPKTEDLYKVRVVKTGNPPKIVMKNQRPTVEK